MKNSIISIFIILLFPVVVLSQSEKFDQGVFSTMHVLRPQQNADKKGQYKYIVQFKEDCYLKSKTNVPFYLARKQEFENDVNIILSSKGITNNRIETEEFYYKTFFGAAFRCTPALIDEIKKLDYVKSVVEDHLRKMNLTESLDLMNIPSVWEDYGVLGDSIKIGIFDTGIDWTHPDLGGGFGPGHKVIDGANFVNPYAPPMDDHGHGTHVAGIAAANGEIKGVAPNALLIACKVLDENGGGYDSDILEAVDYAVDPNNDNNTEDKLDIVNMSFGSKPFEGDLLPGAINTAINEGVVFCISAGNEYNYYSIGSPGITTRAITVGNLTKDFEIAISSSKGPTLNYIIKPDIVAIGTNVNSTLPQGNYGEASGTSMSAPMVAGACALLKQLHPDWNPDEIKSALVNTATKLEADVMAQGNGVMNLHQATQVSTTISPALVNFGEINDNEPVWNVQKQIKLKNHGTVSKLYNVEVVNTNNGITCVSDTNQIEVAANQEKTFDINLELKFNDLGSPNENSNGYEGEIKLVSEFDTLTMPWACVKAVRTNIFLEKPSLDDMNITIYLLSDNSFYYKDHVQDSVEEFKVMSGKYDIVALFYNHNELYTVIKENVLINTSGTIPVSYEDAKNEIKLNGIDESGTRLTEYEKYQFKFLLIAPDTYPFFYYAMNSREFDKMYFSDFNENIDILFSENMADTSLLEARLVNHVPLQKLHSDTILNAQSNIYQNLDISYQQIASDNTLRVFYSSYIIDTMNLYVDVYGGTLKYEELKSNSFEYDFYINDNNFSRGFCVYNISYSKHLNYNNSCGFLRGDNGKVAVFRDPNIMQSTYLSPPGDTLIVGNNSVYYNTVFINNTNFIKFFIQITGFHSELRTADYHSTKYSIYDANEQLIKSDNYLNYSHFQVDEPGVYTVSIVDTGFTVNGVQGRNEARCTFDLLKDDKNPPSIGFMEVRNEQGKPTNNLNSKEKGSIYFSVYDLISDSWYPLDSSSVKAYIKNYDEQEWQLLTFEGQLMDSLFDRLYRYVYYGIIDSQYVDYDSTAIDFKLVISDPSNNKTEIVIEPVVTVGKMQAPYIYPISNVDTFSVKENELLQIEKEDGILANDAGEAPFNLYASLNRTTLHGTLELNLDGSFNYQPDTNYFGKDNFYYYAHNQKDELKSQLTKAVIIVEEGDAIEEVANDQFSVFPNPFSNEITITLNQNNSEEIMIEVYDVQGKILSQFEKQFSNQIKLTKAEMNINNEGTYFIEINTKNKTYTNKIFYKK